MFGFRVWTWQWSLHSWWCIQLRHTIAGDDDWKKTNRQWIWRSHRASKLCSNGTTSVIVDQQLLIDTKDDETISSNSSSMRNVIIACITSILQVGICCSDEVPTDRPSIGDALKELQAIRDKFQNHLCLKGRCQLAEVWRISYVLSRIYGQCG